MNNGKFGLLPLSLVKKLRTIRLKNGELISEIGTHEIMKAISTSTSCFQSEFPSVLIVFDDLQISLHGSYVHTHDFAVVTSEEFKSRLFSGISHESVILAEMFLFSGESEYHVLADKNLNIELSQPLKFLFLNEKGLMAKASIDELQTPKSPEDLKKLITGDLFIENISIENKAIAHLRASANFAEAKKERVRLVG